MCAGEQESQQDTVTVHLKPAPGDWSPLGCQGAMFTLLCCDTIGNPNHKLPAYDQAKYSISISVLWQPNQLCIVAFEGNIFIIPEISASNRSLISLSLILLSLNP